MSTHNIGFYEEMEKLSSSYHQKSSSMHFNCSSDYGGSRFSHNLASYQMSLVVRKPVFGVSDQVLHNPGCTATEDG